MLCPACIILPWFYNYQCCIDEFCHWTESFNFFHDPWMADLIPMVPNSCDLGCELSFPAGEAQIVGIVTGGKWFTQLC